MKRSTKIILVVLIIVITLITAVSVLVNSDISAEPYKYVINDNNTITLTEYTGDEKYIFVPSEIDDIPVTHLEGTFEKNRYIKQVFIRSGLVDVGALTFYGCENLEKVHIPETVSVIREKAFADSGIREIDISLVWYVGDACFSNCENLGHIVSDSTKRVEFAPDAFSGTDLKYAFLQRDPVASEQSFPQECRLLVGYSQLLATIYDWDFMSEIMLVLHNKAIEEAFFYILLVGFLVLLLVFVVYKIETTVSAFLDGDLFNTHNQQSEEIIMETGIPKEQSTFFNYRQINRFSDKVRMLLTVTISFICVYFVLVASYYAGATFFNTTSEHEAVIALLMPGVAFLAYKFIRSVYRTIKVRLFDGLVRPRVRVIKPKKKRGDKNAK